LVRIHSFELGLKVSLLFGYLCESGFPDTVTLGEARHVERQFGTRVANDLRDGDVKGGRHVHVDQGRRRGGMERRRCDLVVVRMMIFVVLMILMMIFASAVMTTNVC